MPRVKRGFKARRRHNKILKMAKGMRGARSRLFRTAREQVFRGLKLAFRERKRKKREYRALWIVRINAAVRSLGSRYSVFAGWLARSGVALDRKALAELAVHEPGAFTAIVEQVKAAFAGRPNAAVHLYPEADHGFNCTERSVYHAPSAALALERSLQFLQRHVG